MCKKINTATITFHAPKNNGAFLQAYALQYYISNSLHLNNDIIDFQSEAQKKQYRIFHSKNGIVGFIRDIGGCLHYSDLVVQKEKYELLRSKYLKCTTECSKENEVLMQALNYDILICGSDQIWNAELNDFSPAYFLPGFNNKISYACSLGKSVSTKTQHYLKKYLSEFSAVSVREKSSAVFLKDIFNIEAFCCIDPTLLIGKDVYEKIIDTEKIPVPKKYIFLYTVKFQNYILEIAETLSQIYDLPIYTIFSTPSVPAGIRAEKHHIHVLYSGGPADFLTYIQNASLVISDSFHGIIFSVIFHKNFFRGQAITNGEPVRDERLDSFLKLVGLSDRVLTPNQRESSYYQMIDWDSVDSKLNIVIQQSRKWLENAIFSMAINNSTVNIPHLIEDKHNCCGCGACHIACPTNSIIMFTDEEGFEYPHINSRTCIRCNKCLSVCSFKRDQESNRN